MKLAALAGAVVLLAAAGAQALDLGGAVQNKAKDAAHAGGKIAVEKEINKNLAEKNCAFTPKTTDLTCDLQDILKTLKEQKTIAEKSGFASDVDIFVKIGQGKDKANPSLGSDRSSKVRTELIKKVSWWDWYDTSIDGDQLELSVKIR
jgi:uncharacterized protein YjhX (UPF0386 family)